MGTLGGAGLAAGSADLQAGRGGALGSSEREKEWERVRVGTRAGRLSEE